MSNEMKDLVRKGYEEGRYDAHFRTSAEPNPFEKMILDKMLGSNPAGLRILDLAVALVSHTIITWWRRGAS